MKVLLAAVALACIASAESGRDAWLRYQRPAAPPALPGALVVLGDSPILVNAREELLRGLRAMTGRVARIEPRLPKEGAFVAGKAADVRVSGLSVEDGIAPEGYLLRSIQRDGATYVVVAGADDRGVLYGVFALLRKVATGEPVTKLNERSAPYAPVRWVNHWDNLDGTIERGYGGRSIFWDGLHARSDLTRVAEYGRLLASIGINGCSINNVNVNPRILATDFLPEIARIADVLRPWGVRTAISVDFGSPRTVGGFDTFDPLDPKVIAWWKAKTDDVYKAVPDLAGFIIKADSEGRVGPSAYGRTHADAANVVARALAPHGGLIFYRGFVYDNKMDWRNLKNDRARAADDNFRALDGMFDANAVIQIKNGPIDFQVREPASPLFGTLEKTNQVIELQITQEYFGQARHTVFLAPLWKDALDFDLQAKGPGTPVKALAAGKVFDRRAGGMIGVSNVGLDDNWFGNHLSQANLYAFGRLAWNPDLSAARISDEWTRLTFGNNPAVVAAVNSIQLTSYRTFENYTGPLGLQTLTDIVGNHYGVSVEASERNGWGQWHRADNKGVGMDRTSATGTGFIGQYRPAVAKRFETLDSCPDDLLVFLHHVPYTYRLKSGKSVIQYLYDSHYEGASAVESYVRQWKTLEGLVDERRYQEILAQLEYQAGQAEVWRDAVVNWFQRASGIADANGRVGKHPQRWEAESMSLEGYIATDVTPWEAASGGKAISCSAANCSAKFQWQGAAGWYDVKVRYFDQNNGRAGFTAYIGGQVVDAWVAADRLPSAKLDGSTSARRVVRGVMLKRGDEIRIAGVPEGGESAALDYVEVVAAGR
jgi:alpha-glucuronidase